MKKNLTIWLGSMSLLAVLLAPARVVSLGQQTSAREAHPHIEAAMKALEQAKGQLEHAAHDFGGHRVKALEHVNQALQECRDALRYDAK
jgi:hypothetical protein